jgi:hypothetical protein
VKWLADENPRIAIVRGLLRRAPQLDTARVQQIPEIVGADDPDMPEWAARQERVVLTHDLSTMLPAMLRILGHRSNCALPTRLAQTSTE